MGLYLIIFVSYTTTSIPAFSTQSSALYMLGTQLPVTQLTQFSSLVLYMFIAVPPKWRCHESDEFFKALFSATHMWELRQHSSRAQPFTLLHFTASHCERTNETPSCPSSQETRHLLVRAEELTCWGGDAQHGLARHTWPSCLSSSPTFRVSYQVILCFINNLTF